MNQTTIFDMLYPKYKITKPIRLIELFAGYGSQYLALKYLGANVKHYKICEWATKSIQAYNDLHIQDYFDYSGDLSDDNILKILIELGVSINYNEPATREQLKRQNFRKIYNNIIATNNLVNIQNAKGEDFKIVNKDQYEYIMTYSFPCQDLSLAGKGKGMVDTSTRSGMLWEVERILNELKTTNSLPQILLMENVPQVHGFDNVEHFNKWQLALENMGYKNYFQDLIATDYGIPQTRNRCFMVSILGDYSYTFPKPIPLKLKLKDMLEDNVDKKYYLSDKMLEYCLGVNQKESDFPRGERFLQSLSQTNDKNLATTSGGNDRGVVIGTYQYAKSDNFMNGKDRLQLGKEVSDTLQTTPKEGVVYYNSIFDIFFTIFDLCSIIDIKEKDKYERSRELLQILWEEIGKKEIWQEIRRFISIQEKKILQSNLYENELYEDRKSQSKISTSTPNSSEYNESITDREKMFNMWKNWKTRYTPQRWELSEQQFRQFNLFMQELSYETTQGETSMQSMWQTNERFRILQQTLFKIQEIWRPNENKISNGLRIRKLTPREAFRLMGVKDEDYYKIAKNQSNSSLYHLAGDSLVTLVFCAIMSTMIDNCKSFEQVLEEFYLQVSN